MIRQFTPLVEAADGLRVQRQIESTFVGCGKTVTEFEQAVANQSGVRHCIATTSGTTGLMLALMAVGDPRRARKILFPSYTFLAGANAARLLGFDVELVDIEADTLCMSPRLLQEALERGEPTAAVIFVDHNAYIGSRRADVREICDRFGVALVEDSSQCFGVLTNLVGHVGVFSFSVPKLVTTGQGGCVITNDDGVAATVRNLTDHGGDWRQRRLHDSVGGNFKFNDILAAFGLSQIERLDHLRLLRKQVFESYRARLRVLDHGMDSAWMVIHRTANAERLAVLLRARAIEAVQLYRPIHHNPPFHSHRFFPEAEAAYRECLYLPSSLALTSAEILYVCQSIEDLAKSV